MTDERKTTLYQWVRLTLAVAMGGAILFLHTRVQPFSDIGLVAALAFAGALGGDDLRKLIGGGK
ncbi:hypothetical protein [Oceaniradius stylonematis]|uniref:hypothetical protein n=1 Tax=Oceaniradius stylonematis TaxID=2184161 RepID=UPI00273D1DA5|nr:hypothetical protein [Oceaniradius stylonematis]